MSKGHPRFCLPLLLVSISLAGCHDDSTDDPINGTEAPMVRAIAATHAPDYSSAAVSVVDTDSPYTAQNNTAATGDDIVIRGSDDGSGSYYVIGRYGSNRISRYSIANPATPIYTYSTNDTPDEQSNPYDIVVASPTKAYVLRYGSGKIWIVNPGATTEAAFKIGEIDLSQYDSDGIPDMSAGLIDNGRLYVTLQRLEGFASVKSGYVAVIDTATDLEIETGKGEGGLKGIKLPVMDPVRIGHIQYPLGAPVPSYASGTDTIFVTADGGFDNSFAPQYEGGIVGIAPDTLAATLVLDDGDADSHPYGQITDSQVIGTTRMYFVGNADFASQTLYRLPAGSAPVVVSGFAEQQLGSIALDPEGKLWVGRTDSTAPGLTVLNLTTDAETVAAPLIDTVLTPANIDFSRTNTL